MSSNIQTSFLFIKLRFGTLEKIYNCIEIPGLLRVKYDWGFAFFLQYRLNTNRKKKKKGIKCKQRFAKKKILFSISFFLFMITVERRLSARKICCSNLLLNLIWFYNL